MSEFEKAMELIESLNYACYRHNRRVSPNREPSDWKMIFGDKIERFEERYQREVSHAESH